ncbi:MAG: TonB-dependent receptor, partial [Bacteroidetes bacterium]|nr:TonB-dependent receptor [Bacteroidota bacterium]
MNRLITVLFFILFLPGIVLAGTTGKLKGKVTDQQTGEPLIGANVLVIGTSFGAATDVNGDYTIGNLEPGFYEIKFSYIGYQTKTITNLRINQELTTELNLELDPEGVEVGEVVIVAQRPLINKYNTNANRIMTSEDIEALPVRGIGEILALTPGVILKDNTIFIRGGRQDEVGYYLEGTSVTDPMVGGARVTLVQDALEELTVQSGGYTAEFGNANSGIIRTQIKTGAPNWRFSAEYMTDNVGFQGSDDRFSGERTLGAYWNGYNEFVGTISGPLFSPQFKLFGLFNYNYVRDQNPQGLPGFDLGIIGDPSFGDTLDIFYPAGPIQGNSLQNYTGTGSLQMDFNPTIVRLIGTYTTSTSFNPWTTARTTGAIANYLNVARTEKIESSDLAVNLKLTHLLSPTTFFELNVGYAANDLNRFDPLLEDNFLMLNDETGWGGYGDSVTNANLAGVTWSRDRGGNIGQYQRPKRFNLFLFAFNAPGDVVAGYQILDRRNYNATLNFNTIVNKVHNIKFGGEYQYYDIRNYSMGNELTMNLPGLLNENDALADDNPSKISPGQLIRRRGVNNFGYNAFGERTNEGLPEWEQARNPVFLGIYLQDTFEAEDLIINAGLRFDYIDIANWIPIDPSRPELTWTVDNDLVEGGLVKTPTFSSLSPRLGFSFPITD